MKADTEKLQRKDEEFAARTGEQLRNSVDELDAATLSRLNRSRQAALDSIGRSAVHRKRRNQWLPVGVAATVAVIAVTLWQSQVPEPGASVPLVSEPLAISDDAVEMELLFHDADLEMYEELEFFAWLSDEVLEDELENIG